jgi:hypothetical protein
MLRQVILLVLQGTQSGLAAIVCLLQLVRDVRRRGVLRVETLLLLAVELEVLTAMSVALLRQSAYDAAHVEGAIPSGSLGMGQFDLVLVSELLGGCMILVCGRGIGGGLITTELTLSTIERQIWHSTAIVW